MAFPTLRAKPWALMRADGSIEGQPDQSAGLRLSRALVRVRRVSLADVPAAQQAAVARNLALAWAPFDDSGYRIWIQREHALLLAWDVQRTRGLTVPVWPENCLRARPAQDGLRWVRATEGVECEQWQGGELIASRWWPQAPQPNEAEAWLAGSSVGLDSVHELLPQARAQWPAQELAGLADPGGPLQRTALRIGLVLLCGMTGATAMQASAAYRQRAQMLEQARASAAQNEPLLKQRDAAQKLRAQVEVLAQAQAGAPALELLEHLAHHWPSGAVLREWELKGLDLRMVLEVPAAASRSQVLADLQAGGWLRDLRELREGTAKNELVLGARLSSARVPVANLAQAAAPAPAAAPVVPPAPPPVAVKLDPNGLPPASAFKDVK